MAEVNEIIAPCLRRVWVLLRRLLRLLLRRLLMFGRNVELLRWLLTLYYWANREDLLGLGFGSGAVTAVSQSCYPGKEASRHVHICVEDPVKIFFSLFRTSRPAAHPPKIPWLPINAVFLPSRCFVSLHILDLSFLVGGKFVISIFDR